MKTSTKFILLLLTIVANISSNAQSGVDWQLVGNTVTTTEFLGATGTSTIPLNIRHNAAGQPINFWTNNRQRMTIVDGTATPTSGYIGMGNNLPAGFTPLDRLHLAQTAGIN